MAAALGVAACTSTSTQSTRVVIEDLPATDSWRATLQFARPVETVTFDRPSTFREQSWKIASPASGRWDGDRIVLAAPAREVVLELPTDTRDLFKNYSVNLAFTDGGRMLFNGHFRTGDWPHAWTFRSPRTIRLLGLTATRELRWSEDDDTYVYFGSIVPVPTERMTLIVDPGLPPWIEKQMRELTPKQLDYFAEKLGRELGFKPLVLLAYGGDATSGLTFNGSTLTGLLQISVHGKGWSKPSAEATEMWFSRLAHEMFHLASQPEEEAEWLSEAAADHAAFLAMRDLGVIDEARRRRLLIEHANECIVLLEGKPLRQAHGRNVYTCGAVLLERVGADVYRRVLASRPKYSTADFLAALPPAEKEVVTQVLQRGPGVATDVFLAEQLHAAGIEVTRVDPPSAAMSNNVARRMLSEVTRSCACRTEVAAICKNPAGVERVNGIDVRRQASQAWSSLLATAESTVVFDGKEMSLRCGREDADPTWEKLLR